MKTARQLRRQMAHCSALISVAIERQSASPGGIDVVAYAVLRDVQGKLGGAAGMVPGERPVTGRVEVPHETPAASPGCSVCGGSGVRCCEFGAAVEQAPRVDGAGSDSSSPGHHSVPAVPARSSGGVV